MLQVKYFIALMNVFNHIFCSVSMGVADKNLTKIIILHQSDDMGDPVFVQLIKDIIQQKNRGGVRQLLDKMKLCQFQGYQKGFLLPLAPKFFNGVPSNGKAKVILMYADGSVLQRSVFFNILFQEIQKGIIAQLTFVGKVDLLIFLGDILVLFLKNG